MFLGPFSSRAIFFNCKNLSLLNGVSALTEVGEFDIFLLTRHFLFHYCETQFFIHYG